MATRVVMPQLGESVVEGTVTKWLRQEGQNISEFEPLLEVNTDKVDTEIPAPATGTVLKLYIGEGTTVRAGTLLAMIGQPGESVPEGGESISPAHVAPAITPPPATRPPSPPQRDLGFISPVVAKIAQERGVDLQMVTGTGAGRRITKKDVLAYIENIGATVSLHRDAGAERGGRPATPELAPWEIPGDGDLFRPTELQFASRTESTPPPSPTTQPPNYPTSQPAGASLPLTTIRRSIAEHMVRSRRTSPHVTSVMEVDMSAVVAHREANKAAFERDGVNLTFTAYFVMASAVGLRAFPIVNSSWGDDAIHLHQPVNIGVATSLGEEGLIVPVLKNAEEKSLLGISRELNDLAARARAHKLKPDEVTGGTFTITNHGVNGSLFAMPIINQPQAAILGVGAIQKRVVVTSGDAIAIRPMVYLSLTIDHRILDGAVADFFTGKVKEALENWK